MSSKYQDQSISYHTFKLLKKLLTPPAKQFTRTAKLFETRSKPALLIQNYLRSQSNTCYFAADRMLAEVKVQNSKDCKNQYVFRSAPLFRAAPVDGRVRRLPPADVERPQPAGAEDQGETAGDCGGLEGKAQEQQLVVTIAYHLLKVGFEPRKCSKSRVLRNLM
jgi:hypothetical protein